MKTFVVFLFCFFQVLVSLAVTPEILWSNRDTHISDIQNSALSETGDSIIIFEKNYINIYDSKNYDLISRHNTNIFENISTAYVILTSRNIFLRFPLIMSDLNIFNFENFTVDVKLSGGVLNLDYYKERDILVYTLGYEHTVKYDKVFYSTVTSFDILTRKPKKICELVSSNGILKFFDAAIINDNEFLVSRTDGIFLYYVNSKIYHKLDSLKSPETSKHTRIQDNIYLFNGLNDDKIISYNTLTGTHSNFQLDLSQINNLDSFNIISKESLINKPGEIFVKYSYFKNNSQGEPEKHYGLSGINLQNNSIIFNINLKYSPTIIGHDGEFVHIRYQDSTKNEADELSEVFQKIQISNGEIILEKRLFKTIRKVSYVTQSEILRINNSKIEKIDKSNGQQVSSVDYNESIKTLYTYPNSDDYFILYSSNKISYPSKPEFIDYHYIRIANTHLRVSPDQSTVLLISPDYIAVMDAKTTGLIELLGITSGPIEFFTDSTFFYSSSFSQRIYNIRTRESYLGKFNNFSVNKFRKTNKEGIFLDTYYDKITKIDLANPEEYEILYEYNDNSYTTTLTNSSLSDDEKYVAIIKKSWDVKYKTQILIVDRESNQIVHTSPLVDWESMYFDVLFLHNQNRLVYSEVDYGKGTCKLTLFDVEKKEVIAQVEVPIHKAKNYLATNFWMDNRNLELTEENKIILHSALEGALIFNSEDLSIEKRIDFSKHTDEYNALGYNEYEQIFKFYLWKQQRLFSFQLFTYNPPTPQLILSESLIDNDMHRRIFTYANNISFNFRTKPLFGVAFKDLLYEIDYLQHNFKHKVKLTNQEYGSTVCLSNDDSKLAHSYDRKFSFINLNNGKNYAVPPKEGFLGTFAFNNNYFIQSGINIFYITDIHTGRFVDTIISKPGSIFGYPRQFLTWNIEYLITGHDDGIVRFWKQWLPSPINKINLGSRVTEMYLIDNDTKLYVNTESGFHYLIQINDSLFSDVKYNSVSTNNTLNIYPNPAEDFITIQLSNKGIQPFAAGDKVQIFDVLGIEVMSELIHPMTASHRMNIERLPTGVYFIRIGTHIEKFVKM